VARVAVIDDFEAYAELAAAPLRQAGHEVLTATAPIDWTRVVRFQPEVVTFGVYRRPQAFNRPIVDPRADILGYEAIIQAEGYPAIQALPIMIVGDGLEASDLPTSLRYERFLMMPNDMSHYAEEVGELAEGRKRHRRLSEYICPLCGGHLVALRRGEHDLFCPRCGASVAIIDEHSCSYLTQAGRTGTCTLAQITPAG
jgi:hypothetical protein